MVRSGYFSPTYGATYSAFGEIVTLPHSQIQLISRKIGDGLFDLLGVYPFVVCNDWPRLKEDTKFLRETGAVSVVFVADPFEGESVRQAVSGWNLCRDFKTHLVVDLHQDWRGQRSKKVRNYTRRAFKLQGAEVVESTREFAGEFWRLYQNIIVRHQVTGVQRLSLDAIADQLEVDGAVLVVAGDGGATTGALLSYAHGPTANAHLMCLSEKAYGAKTSYALYYASLTALEERGCRYVSLGGPAGLSGDLSDGLFLFKKRWANDRRVALLCGNILNHEAYESLTKASASGPTDYFPAYRAPDGLYPSLA